MHYEMKLNAIPFKEIESGMKTIEMRVDKGKRRNLEIGDTITFTHRNYEDRKIESEVIALHRFKSFKELYENLPMEECGYSEEEAKSADWHDMLEYYTEDEIERFGVVGIEIKLI